MQDFIYSVNITLPIILIVILGYLLRQKGVLNESFVAMSNKLCFNVAFPVLLFQDLASIDLEGDFDLLFVVFCMGVTTICFLSVWFFARIFLKEKSMRGAFVQGCFRSSVALMGIALIQNIYGSSTFAPFMIIGAVPLYNVYSVVVLAAEGPEDGGTPREHAVSVVKKIATNPLILGILAGCLFALSGLSLPTGIDRTLDSLASLGTPLALLTLGAGFNSKNALARWKPAFWACAVKLVLQGAVFVPIAMLMDFSGEALVAIMIMLCAPTTPSTYIMAKSMKNDEDLAASIVLLTSAFSAFTLTGWIFLLRISGLL